MILRCKRRYIIMAETAHEIGGVNGIRQCIDVKGALGTQGKKGTEEPANIEDLNVTVSTE
jgi:hypothetical protein